MRKLRYSQQFGDTKSHAKRDAIFAEIPHPIHEKFLFYAAERKRAAKEKGHGTFLKTDAICEAIEAWCMSVGFGYNLKKMMEDELERERQVILSKGTFKERMAASEEKRKAARLKEELEGLFDHDNTDIL